MLQDQRPKGHATKGQGHHLEGQEEAWDREDWVPADSEEKPLWHDCRLVMEPLEEGCRLEFIITAHMVLSIH